MPESTDSQVVFTETLRMRSFHLCLWTTLSAFSIAFCVLLYWSTNSGFAWFLMVFIGMIAAIMPTIKHLIGRIIVKVKTDGLYVQTTFPFRKRLKLFGWEQLVSCEIKYYPTFGALGFYQSGLFAGWTYGSYGAWNQNTCPLLRWKPVFGEKEFHFKITRKGVNHFIVMDSYIPSDFIIAVEQMASSFLNMSFKVTIEEKPSFRERYYRLAISFSIAVIFVLILIGITILVRRF
jgi:hypothetical protein